MFKRLKKDRVIGCLCAVAWLILIIEAITGIPFNYVSYVMKGFKMFIIDYVLMGGL